MIEDKDLWSALLSAVQVCTHASEEEGGLILKKEAQYLFVKIRNIYEGTATAIGLYETDKLELKERIFSRMGDGWQMHASFHTHPCFSATPSSTDMTYLFQGFKYNYIYAPRPKAFSITSWEGDNSQTKYILKETIEALLDTDNEHQ
jgi:hypothetical protein